LSDLLVLLSAVCGLVFSIIVCAVLNKSKGTRILGIIFAIIGLYIWCNHNGSFLKVINNYNYDDIPLLLNCSECFLEGFIYPFPVVRLIIGLMNLDNDLEGNERTLFRAIMLLIRNLLRMFM
jgi:hypothetical protein